MMKYMQAILLVLYFISCDQPGHKEVKQESLPYYITADFTPHWMEVDKELPGSIHHISGFSFVDQNGRSFTEKTIAGKIYVADFFFTSCQGICPKLTKNLCLVQAAFKEDTAVVLLSHSVTPGKDDTAVLKRYARNNGVLDNKWFLLTGNKDSIYTIARKSYFADEAVGEQLGVDDFLHTENVFLIDAKRRIRGIYKGTLPSEIQSLIRDIRILKQENK
ncbi:MAG: SCO family protein [Ferruginibacter sp.]